MSSATVVVGALRVIKTICPFVAISFSYVHAERDRDRDRRTHTDLIIISYVKTVQIV